MNIKLRFNIVTIFLLLCVQTTASAQQYAEKEFNERFPLSANGELKIDNAYGDIVLTSWDKEEVEIQIVVKVKRKNAKQYLNQIEPEFSDNQNYVSVISLPATKKKTYVGKLIDRFNPVEFDHSKVDIDYVVSAPKNAKLTIINKFGDVTVIDFTGELETTLEHSDLRINGKPQKADLSIKYGSLTVNELPIANLSLKNTNATIETSDRLSIEASGSEIDIRSVGQVTIDSNKDQFTINAVDIIKGKSRLTTTVIRSLPDRTELELSISDLIIEDAELKDPILILDQNASNIQLNLGANEVEIDALLEGGILRLPKTVADLETTILDEKKQLREITATLGNNPKGLLKLSGKKGTIEVSQ